MGLLNSIPTPTLNFQPALHKTPEELLSHMKALGITFDRGDEASEIASFITSSEGIDYAAANYPRPNFKRGINKGFLCEKELPSLLTYNEELDNPVWTKSSVTVGANFEAAPDGTVTADYISPSSAGNDRRFQRSITVTAATSYKTVLYAKASGINWIIVYGVDFVSGTFFDLVNGAVGDMGSADSASITQLANGWCRIVVESTSTSTTGQIYVNIADGNGSDAVSVTGGVYFWGLQLFSGTYDGSYISSSASLITKNDDNARISGAEFSAKYGDEQGTIVCDFNIPVNDPTNNQYLFSADDGTSAEMLRAYINASGDLIISVVSSSSESVSLNMGAITAETDYSVSITYDSNGISASLNGGAIVSDATITLPTPSAFGIGRKTYEDTEILNGTIGRCLIFNQKVSDDLLKSFSRL